MTTSIVYLSLAALLVVCIALWRMGELRANLSLLGLFRFSLEAKEKRHIEAPTLSPGSKENS